MTTQIQTALVRLAQINQRMTDLKSEKDDLTATVVEAMQADGRKTISALGVKGTLVAPSTVVIDPDRLKGDLTAKQWNQITKSVVDKELLEARMATGDIDPNIVASASEEKHSKPYVKLSGKLELPTTPQDARKVRPRKKATAAPKKAVAKKAQ